MVWVVSATRFAWGVIVASTCTTSSQTHTFCMHRHVMHDIIMQCNWVQCSVKSVQVRPYDRSSAQLRWGHGMGWDWRELNGVDWTRCNTMKWCWTRSIRLKELSWQIVLWYLNLVIAHSVCIPSASSMAEIEMNIRWIRRYIYAPLHISIRTAWALSIILTSQADGVCVCDDTNILLHRI